MIEISAQELDLVRSRAYRDPVYFCNLFLPTWFYAPLEWVHRGIIALALRKSDFLLNFGEEKWGEITYTWDQQKLEKLAKNFVWKEDPDDPKSPAHSCFELVYNESGTVVEVNLLVSSFVSIMLPRGFGKTTVMNACNLYMIVFREETFLVLLSETATHAEEQLGNIKRELEDNELLRLVFENLVPARLSGKKWAEDRIETTTGVTVLARGRGGQIRGKNINSARPSRIIFDDVEDDESVKTEEQRKKVRDWLMGVVIPALPQMGKPGSILGLGTLLHAEALLMTLARDPEWISIRFGALDAEGEPIAPYYMTKAAFNRKRQSFAKLGLLSKFHMEFMSELTFEGDQRVFKIEHIRYEILQRAQFAAVAMAMDPAISEDRKADYSAIGVTGMTERGQHHVLECWMQRGVHPRELIDKFFELHFQYLPNKHGIESIQYQAALIHLTREEMFRKGKTFGNKAYFEIVPIKHNSRVAKETRVEAVLGPRYAAGYITHQKRIPLLETQFMDWPNGKKDGPDVIAMAITLLDPYAALAFEVGEAEDGTIIDRLAQDQYPPLEEALGGEWRSAP